MQIHTFHLMMGYFFIVVDLLVQSNLAEAWWALTRGGLLGEGTSVMTTAAIDGHIVVTPGEIDHVEKGQINE